MWKSPPINEPLFVYMTQQPVQDKTYLLDDLIPAIGYVRYRQDFVPT